MGLQQRAKTVSAAAKERNDSLGRPGDEKFRRERRERGGRQILGWGGVSDIAKGAKFESMK